MHENSLIYTKYQYTQSMKKYKITFFAMLGSENIVIIEFSIYVKFYTLKEFL